jgi:hypothetical protein
MGIDTYGVERIRPHKQYAVWGVTGNKQYPLLYLQKPKWMTDKQYEKICKCIQLNAPKNILD